MTKKHLSEFITEFIQPGYGLRKGEKNHIYYIHKTINRVFAKHIDKQEKYSPEEILNAFYENDFLIKEEHNVICSLEGGGRFHGAWVKLKVDDIKDLYLRKSNSFMGRLSSSKEWILCGRLDFTQMLRRMYQLMNKNIMWFESD